VTYAVLADMQARFETDELIQLTDEAMAGAIGEVAMATVLAEADNLINSYLGRYTLPLTTTPAVLRDYACDIARYRLYKGSPTEAVATRYKDAIAWLKLLASGSVVLDIAPGVAAPAPDNTILFQGSERQFSRDSLRGY
jgi:phage gp36-like protein